MERSRPLPEREVTELLRRATALVAAARRTELDGLELTTLGADGETMHLYARPRVAASLLATLDALPRELARTRQELRTVHDARARSEAELAARAAETERARATPSRRSIPDPTSPGMIADVPVALVAPFQPDPRTLAAAKTNPLLALAVQATKAMQPGATELERARLIAMAFAASQGDMKRFWAARQQRSARSPSGPRNDRSARRGRPSAGRRS